MTVRVVERFAEARVFAETVWPYLLGNEAAHNLIFGVLHALLHEPDRYRDGCYLAAVRGATGIEGVAIRTPPYPLALSEVVGSGAVAAIADDVYRVQPDLPELLALPTVADTFVCHWRALAGREGRIKWRQQIYALARVKTPSPLAPGRLRAADSADGEPLLRWAEGFQRDAFHDSSVAGAQSSREELDTTLKGGGLFVWEVDGAARAMAAAQGPTPHGIRLSWVYTPPEYRRQGYASALVAALSQHLLECGRRFVFLFADLHFPTSNHIYQAVGFEAVCEMNVYSLEQGEVRPQRHGKKRA